MKTETTQPDFEVKNKEVNMIQQVKTEFQCKFEKFVADQKTNNTRKTAKDFWNKEKEEKKSTLEGHKILIKKIDNEWTSIKQGDPDKDNPGEQKKSNRIIERGISSFASKK